MDRGSLYVGSVETVATKIAHAVRVLNAGRFDMIYSAHAAPFPPPRGCVR